ncbi:hypothetical protein [uncultured Rhodospira sp.]|uniref:hypothetical protein n=1 Tax=uncultured Rhodospira sp. TaxID=1936189 RepID=UPI002624EA69|nr:hypothetical protein [uncultured Rhodospira sp.]
MFPNLLRPTRPTEVVPKDFIDLERIRVLEDHKTRHQTIRLAFILGLVNAVVGLGFGGIGLALVALAGDAASSIITFGDVSVETASVGVGCVVIGAGAFVVSLRSVLAVLKVASNGDAPPGIDRSQPDDA